MVILSIGSSKRLTIAGLVAVLLAIPAIAAPQDITTLLAIFLRNLHAGRIVIPVQTTFANLPASATNGTMVYCSDCTEGADPATGGSTGAFALRVNGRWTALDGGSGGGGNLTAEYWIGAADATLTGAHDLSGLATGLVLNTAGTPSAYAGIDCTNQFPRDVSASGVGTCASVALGADVTGTLPIANGGTGQTTATAAFDGLDPLTTAGDLLTHNGTNSIRLALGGYGQSPWTDGSTLSYKSTSYMGGFVSPSFSTSSTTYVDVTGLTVVLPPNLLYAFDCYGTWTTTDGASGTTNGIGISVNGTGGTGQAAVYTLWLQTTASNTSGNNTMSTAAFSMRNENTFDSMTATASTAQVQDKVWQLKGFYYSGSSGDSTFAVRVRSENATPQTAQVKVGSYCLFTRQG